MSSLRYLPVGADELDSLVRLMAAFEAELAAIGGYEDGFDPIAAKAKLQRHGFGPGRLFDALLITEEGDALGYALYSIGFRAEGLQPTLFLSDIFVLAPHRSRGLGELLMRHLAGIAHARNVESLTWTVWRKNPAAIKFYKRLGAQAREEDLPMSLPVTDLLGD